VADTPTGDSKAKAEDTGARANEGQDRDRRRGRKGKGKGNERRSDADDPSARKHRDDSSRRSGDRPQRDRNRDRDRDRDRRSEQPLTAGLFAGVADREMPCRVSGCSKTWTWFGTQQIRSLGKPPPKRMCAEHLAEFEGIDDRQMPCRNNWCPHTWTWTRAAQLYQRERQEKLKPPHRLCDHCFEAEKNTDDREIACKISDCKHTWTWTRDAQLRHRAWVGRQQAKEADEELEEGEARELAEVAPSEASSEIDEPVSEAAGEVEAIELRESESESESEPVEQAEQSLEQDESADAEAGTEELDRPGKKRRRKRRRKRKIPDGPPEKLCERCFARLGHLEPIEIPCKVHGCTNTWAWERDGQLRAWAALDGQENVTELPQPPRRMCNSCFEFVRRHSDRDVPCGRPDCDKSWIYKTGAQLQDFLAGRTQDPIRLCEECSRSQFTISSSAGVQVPEGSEVMPCQVAGCSGSWVYIPGMQLSSADPDAAEPPADRMCDDCRVQRGEPGRDPRRVATSPAVADEVSDTLEQDLEGELATESPSAE
jgi:hypothetical protein